MELGNPSLARLLAYWEFKRGARWLPNRGDIDPLELRFAIGNLLLVELVRTPMLRFRYRLWGVNLIADYGVEMTGRHVDELQPPAFAEHVHAGYVATVEAAAPQYEHYDDVIGGRWFSHERLLLPLEDRAAPGQVGMILGCIFSREKREPP